MIRLVRMGRGRSQQVFIGSAIAGIQHVVNFASLAHAELAILPIVQVLLVIPVQLRDRPVVRFQVLVEIISIDARVLVRLLAARIQIAQIVVVDSIARHDRGTKSIRVPVRQLTTTPPRTPPNASYPPPVTG